MHCIAYNGDVVLPFLFHFAFVVFRLVVCHAVIMQSSDLLLKLLFLRPSALLWFVPQVDAFRTG